MIVLVIVLMDCHSRFKQAVLGRKGRHLLDKFIHE